MMMTDETQASRPDEHTWLLSTPQQDALDTWVRPAGWWVRVHRRTGEDGLRVTLHNEQNKTITTLLIHYHTCGRALLGMLSAYSPSTIIHPTGGTGYRRIIR